MATAAMSNQVTTSESSRAHPVWRSGDVVAVVLAIMLLVLFAATPDRDIGDQLPRDFDLGAIGLLAVAAVALLLSRRAPVLGAAVSLALNTVWHLAGYTSGLINAFTLVAYYAVGATGDRWRQVVTSVGTVIFILLAVVVATDAPPSEMYDAIGWPLAAVLLGEAVRARRAALRAAADMAVAAEQQRWREFERRATEDRMQIARDLHDTLAHTIGVMTVQAGVLQRVVATDTLRATEAAGIIRRVGKDAMREIRATLNVLRSTEDSRQLAPAPRIEDLGALVATARAAGLDVDEQIDVLDVPAAVGVTVYRVVQEAITNVSRHSLAPRIAIRVAAIHGRIGAVIEDPGPGRSTGSPSGVGHGLVGMRERVEGLGGRLTAEPTSSGGFLVAAWIPLETGP